MKANWKDNLRTIKNEKKRLVALMLIAALGVTMMCGLKAACDDLRYSADTFFDAQQLYDLSVSATLGLTDSDIAAIQSVYGLEKTQGVFSKSLQMKGESGNVSGKITTFDVNGINRPYLIEGHLPEKADEIAVTEKTLDLCGKKIGDKLILSENLEENETPDLAVHEFLITGTVTDSTSVINPDGTTAFRDNDCEKGSGFVLPESVSSKIYTSVVMTVQGAAALNSFSDDYTALIAQWEERIKNTIQTSCETARTDSVKAEAQAELDDARKKAEEGFSDAEASLEAAREELDSGSAQLEAGLLTLEQAEAKIDASVSELENARLQLEAGEAEYEAGRAEVLKQKAETETYLAEAGYPSEVIAQMVEELFASAFEKLAASRAKLDEGWQQYNSGLQEIALARESLESGREELEASRLQLEEGEAEYQTGLEEYNRQKAEAEAKFADAQKEIDEIEACRWVIQDRSALSGYSAISSDADCIESIGTVFPVMFLLVAVLIALTTITRMIEENRSAIGTYKGLGYTNGEIMSKYLLYAALAAFAGGILGNVLGFVLLPEIIIIIFKTMYCIPELVLTYDALYGLAGIALFLAGIVGAAFFSCSAALKLKTAELMRPKAPKNGSRILLERIAPLWNRLSFLNKVTARNLFRYKKRLLMTIFGIMGCTGLLICGFSIKDTVDELMPNQYEKIQHYDILAVNTGGDAQKKMLDSLNHREDVDAVLPFYLTTADLINHSGASLTVQLYVLPDDAALQDYITLKDLEGNALSIEKGGIIITENAGDVLKFGAGDTITLRDAGLNEVTAEVSGLTEYYLGNIVFMNTQTYRAYFGSAPSQNAAMINLQPGSDVEGVVDVLKKSEDILSVTATKTLAENFKGAFQLINMVVYVVIILAGMLAFVVLFTLSTTNISERERELATIKVLGFNNREVYRYVNKETLILTGFGIICGIPLGIGLSEFIGKVLSLPAIVYRPAIHGISYLLAAGIALVFAIIVNLFTNRVVKNIDPVTALKSVE